MHYTLYSRQLAVLALGVALALPGMAASPRPPDPKPITAARSFEMHFTTPLPRKVRVVHYYGETFGMDPSFAWELAPVDDALLKKLVKKAGLQRAAAANRPDPDVYRWPAWWNKQQIGALREVYFQERHNLVRIWVDRPSKRLFIEWINT